MSAGADRLPRRGRGWSGRGGGPVVAVLAAVVLVPLLAPLPSRAGPPAEDPRVAWLREHAIPLATIDPASPDLADLAPLRQVLAGVRVVMLGEATRGDGSAFLAKTRLIRYLHQELGYDVLVFEGSFYDLARAWEDIRAGGDAQQAFARGAFPLYAEAAQLQPLVELIAARATTDRPLAIAGMDPQQAAGGPGGGGVLGDLPGALAGFGIDTAAVAGFPPLAATLRDVLAERYATGELPVPSKRDRDRVGATIAELRRRLEVAPERPGQGGDRAFWLQVLANLESHARSSWALGAWRPGQSYVPAAHNIRDRQMAANLEWLANQRYTGRKMIVWSLNVHLARDLDLLTTGEAATRARFDAMSTVGDEIAATFGKEAYTIALTALAGSTGSVFRDPYPLLPATAGSFEELMGRTGLAAALVDLRQLADTEGSRWLRRSLIARPLSYKELLGIWPRHLDALLFLRAMEPVRRRVEPRPDGG